MPPLDYSVRNITLCVWVWYQFSSMVSVYSLFKFKAVSSEVCVDSSNIYNKQAPAKVTADRKMVLFSLSTSTSKEFVKGQIVL